MHHHAEVLIPTNKNVEEQVADIMAPFKEDEDCDAGFWDWYQIGARYKGRHVPDCDPSKDPKHVETCRLCNGTGDRLGWVTYKATHEGNTLATNSRRTIALAFAMAAATPPQKEKIEITRQFRDDWAEKCNGCNGCNGKGVSVSWPTTWGSHPEDVVHVSRVESELTCYTLIANEHILHKSIWTGKEWVETDFDGNVAKMLRKLGITDSFLVTVDYHY